jgi:hypothetical protein
MADLRTSFVTLEDPTTPFAGMPLHKALEGDPIASKNAHGALVAKFNDSGTDKFAYLEVDSAGNLLVATAANYAGLSNDGSVAGNASYTQVAIITLTADKVYKDLEVLCSCFRDCIFQVIWNDDTTPTTLVSGIRVGAGTFNEMASFQGLEFTAGVTGTQSLEVKAKCLNALSDMSATVSIKEWL